MECKGLDSLDKKLIQLLSKDGRMAMAKIAECLKITHPTVRFRMENLIHSGFLRITGLVNALKVKDFTIAIMGIRLDKHRQLNKKIEEISKLSQVQWVVIVTGCFDIILEAVFTDGMLGLDRFLTEDLSRLGGIRSTESFIVIKAKRKWIFLPSQEEASEK